MMRHNNRSCFVAAALIAIFLYTVVSQPTFAQSDGDVPAPSPIAGQGYHLVKNWDFRKNVLTLDDLRGDFYTRYASSNGTADHLHDEWEVYRDNNNHVLSDGALHLVARVPSGVLKVGSIESGMIRSKWETKYGYFEARMKVPRGLGMWPAFWFSGVNWPPEIDAVEIVDNGGWNTTKNSFHGTIGKFVGKTISTLVGKDGYVPGFDYADDYHTFSIEWTPTIVRHFVDNVLVDEREFQWRHNDGSEGEPTPLVINLAVGAPWPGPPKELSEFPASLDVAYIRAWQKSQ